MLQKLLSISIGAPTIAGEEVAAEVRPASLLKENRVESLCFHIPNTTYRLRHPILKENISLKRNVEVSLWDPKKQKLKGKSSNATEMNQFLDQEHSKLFQCYQDLRLEGKILTPESIKSRYFGDRVHLFSLEDIFEISQ